MHDIQNSHHEVPAFLCDAMLGSLARWLRFFGFDAAYFEPGVSDHRLAEKARVEGRWLLTRDRVLAAAGPRTMLVRSEALDDQLVEVFLRLGVCPAATLEKSRCGECNGVLDIVGREEVAGVTPPHVLETVREFRRCGGCTRVYWSGSHSQRIIARMQKIIGRLS